MSVEARLREGLAKIDAKLPEVDALERYDELGARVRRSRQRRTAVTVIAAAAAVAIGAALNAGLGRDRATPPPVTQLNEWVLVSSVLVGGGYARPVGDEWSKDLGESGTNTYPYWVSVDPTTRRFLVGADGGTALEVMTPGRAEPLFRFECRDDYTGCLGAALGPGPDEVTVVSGYGALLVVGRDGETKRILDPSWLSWQRLAHGSAWNPDGTTLAVADGEHTADTGSLTVTLRYLESSQSTTVYEHSEQAPPWYDAEEHRYGVMPGAFNSWSAPRVTDLQWSPEATQMAFAVATTPGGGNDGERHLQWGLFIADLGTGDVEPVASLGRCSEPVDVDGRHAGVCDEKEPSLSWTPDGESITVLADSKLTAYDLTGKELSSEPSDLIGPIVWLTSS